MKSETQKLVIPDVLAGIWTELIEQLNNKEAPGWATDPELGWDVAYQDAASVASTKEKAQTEPPSALPDPPTATVQLDVTKSDMPSEFQTDIDDWKQNIASHNDWAHGAELVTVGLVLYVTSDASVADVDLVAELSEQPTCSAPGAAAR